MIWTLSWIESVIIDGYFYIGNELIIEGLKSRGSYFTKVNFSGQEYVISDFGDSNYLTAKMWYADQQYLAWLRKENYNSYSWILGYFSDSDSTNATVISEDSVEMIYLDYNYYPFQNIIFSTQVANDKTFILKSE